MSFEGKNEINLKQLIIVYKYILYFKLNYIII